MLFKGSFSLDLSYLVGICIEEDKTDSLYYECGLEIDNTSFFFKTGVKLLSLRTNEEC